MFVPAEWTDIGSVKTEKADSPIDKLRSKYISIGSVSDLLRMRLVVDALLNPPVCLDHAANASEYKEEMIRAVEATTTSRRKDGATADGMARTRSKRTGGPDSSSRENFNQVSRSDAARSKRRRTGK
jgi:hypothetical protein